MKQYLTVLRNIFLSIFPNDAEPIKRNAYYSKAFIKIKSNIEQSSNTGQLIVCREMIDNATPILTFKELTLLRGFLLAKWDVINPVGESYADEMDSIMHLPFNKN